MRWKQFIILGAIVLMLGMALTACGHSDAPAEGTAASEDSSEAQVVSGVINRKGEFLVLLTDDGAYQVMDLAEDVSLDDLSEGDHVNVTYTGELGDEDAPPVVSGIELAG